MRACASEQGGINMGCRRSSLVCLIALVCLVLTVPVHAWGASAGTVDVRVADISDDAEESGGSVSTSINDLELGDKLCGIRFQNITVPHGSTITNAYIEFAVRTSTRGTTNLTIDGEASDDASRFSSNPGQKVSDRTLTTPAVAVTWDNVTAWVAGEQHQSPNLSSIVQEIVGGPGWSSGNSMAFIIGGVGERIAKARQFDAGLAPLLHIEYTSAAVEVRVSAYDDDAEEQNDGNINLASVDLDLFNSGDQAVGIRFQDVVVPQGALITNAYIEFVAAESNTRKTDIVIEGQASDDARAFTSSDSDIAGPGRPTTDGRVEWNNVRSWSTGQKYQTPALTSLVQEIVGRPGWSSGNSMALILTKDTGSRVAMSYDGDSSKSPLLRIEYSKDALPHITVDKNQLGATSFEGSNAAEDSITITNTGGAAMTYTIADDTDWITCSSGGGALAEGGSVTVSVSYTTSALSPGTHDATITVSDPNAWNSPVEILVSVTVHALPESSSCGHVPVYTENLATPAILILLDVSGSMDNLMDVSSGQENPETPDLKDIVKEIIDRPGWASGNAMAFIITGSGHRRAKTYNRSSGSAPLLHVEYNDGTENHEIDIRVSDGNDDAEQRSGGGMSVNGNILNMMDGQAAIGIRFQDVTIPNGAAITNAYIEFVIDGSNDEATSLRVYGQDFDNPPAFSGADNDISNRAETSASVAWDEIEEWRGVTRQQRIQIGKDVIAELVKDTAISWGFGSWSTGSGYVESIDYTKIHEGCKPHSEAHLQALQDAISARTPLSYTPLAPSMMAAIKYFDGDKEDEADDSFVSVDCQPKFLIEVTDGLGNRDTTMENVEQYTNDLCDAGVTTIAVGFGIDDAGQIKKIAEVSNSRGSVSEEDDLYALHQEDGGVGQPFIANSKQELVDALSTITESIKGAIFHGAAPAITTSADLGDTVIVARFDPTDWSGDVHAVGYNAETGQWDNLLWTASDVVPATRNVFTIGTDGTTEIEYTDGLLDNDNYLCKPLGDIINSTPIVVGTPAFYYSFDGYGEWKAGITRDTTIYIGANDGALHAFSLANGEEKWAFFPKNLLSRLDMADDPTFDMCHDDYCHQYFVDGSPQVGDIYDGSTWKTILVCGEREGGEAYFALDVTSGKPPDDIDPSEFLWEFTDAELGQTWADASIERVADSDTGGTTWAVFFGSGYSPTNQANKQAYMYGIVADNKGPLWHDAGANDIDRIKLDPSLNNALASPLVAELNRDDISDRIYLGDLYGTMFRISDIGKGQIPALSKLFEFSPAVTSPDQNPIRAKAAYAYGTDTHGIWVYFGSGRFETQADKTNMNQQYFFGLKDAASSTSAYTLDDLADLEATYVTDKNTGKVVRVIDGFNSAKQSWAIKLDNTSSGMVGSERVTARPIVVGGIVFFATFIPDQDICAGSGDAWLYAVTYDTGLGSTQPVFDLNEDGVIDEKDKAEDIDGAVHNVAAISIGKGEASNPVLYKDVLFATTTVGGLSPLKVSMPNMFAKVNSWKQNF